MIEPRSFTLEDANRTLPYIRAWAAMTCNVPASVTGPDTLSRSKVPAVVSLISIWSLPLVPCAK